MSFSSVKNADGTPYDPEAQKSMDDFFNGLEAAEKKRQAKLERGENFEYETRSMNAIWQETKDTFEE